MRRVLVTGATGNIGLELVRFLTRTKSDLETIVGTRNLKKARSTIIGSSNLVFRQFDFENPNTFNTAFKGIDLLFLLRPPHISNVEKVFRPLLTSAKAMGLKNIVFLSVQGAEQSKLIPHNQIEYIIRELDFNYIFIRPSYFMQNLTTTLLPEIVDKKRISLPSGKAMFNWVDAKDIGEAASRLIMDFEKNRNNIYEITGSANMTFAQVADLITEITGTKIHYRSTNPISFYFMKRKEGIQSDFALVMTLLHFLPRFQSDPKISENYQRLTGKPPTTVRQFIQREKAKLTNGQHKL